MDALRSEQDAIASELETLSGRRTALANAVAEAESGELACRHYIDCAPDVVIKDGQVQKNGGTSLFDKDKVFKSKGWLSFRIPRGTVVDPLLVVRYTNHNERFSADHYQIEVEKPISVHAYKGALDNLARAAVVKAYSDAR